jgi:hypothetical protein
MFELAVLLVPPPPLPLPLPPKQRDSMPVRAVVEVSPCANLESYIEAKFLANGEGSAEDFESIRCVTACGRQFASRWLPHPTRSCGVPLLCHVVLVPCASPTPALP